MNLTDLKIIAFLLGLIANVFCLIYFMPGLWGLLVCFFLLCCTAVQTAKD